MDTLHPIISPAISNINVRLARKMQSGVWKRVGPQQHRDWTPSNRQGSFLFFNIQQGGLKPACVEINGMFLNAVLSLTHARSRARALSPSLLIGMARPTRPLSPQERLYLQIQSYDLPMTESL